MMSNTTDGKASETVRVWSRNNSGALIHAGEFESFDRAELAARVWNRSETRPGMKVDVIANAESTAHATKVRAIY